MFNKTFDVAVVGAGPAGSTLAYRLAILGFDVVLIDKEWFPRKKVCAGGLPARALEILPFDISSVIEKQIFQVNLNYKLRDNFKKNYCKPLIYTVNREKFDNFLVQEAKKAHITFLEGQKCENVFIENNICTIYTHERILKAKIIVGADGANSSVARCVNLKPFDFLHIGLNTEIPILNKDEHKCIEYREMIALDLGSIRNSYAWVFPKNDSLSVGVGVQGQFNFGGRLKDYHTRWLSYLGIDSLNTKLTGHIIPHRISKRPISSERVLLVGDAAGLTNFWTGEGIFFAIKSSQIAANYIKKYLDGDKKAIRDYEVSINKEILPEIRASYVLSLVFNHSSSIAFKLIKKYNYPWDVFCRVMRGDRTFVEIRERFNLGHIIKKFLYLYKGKRNISTSKDGEHWTRKNI